MPRLRKAETKGEEEKPQPNRRNVHPKRISLFDAVAGNATAEGFLPVNPKTSKYRDTISRSFQAVPPETVLFRLKGRPYQGETDPYWAHEKLTEDQQLPDSDLLKAIHTYASDFYSRTYGEDAQVDFHSLDETALLCLGMLMEEMADEILGSTGDLALTEGEAVESTTKRKDLQRSMSVSDASVGEMEISGPKASVTEGPSKPKSSKRRKTEHDAKKM